MISHKELAECLEYNPAIGQLFWRWRPNHHFKSGGIADRWNKKHAGSRAGVLSYSHKGGLYPRRQICIFNKIYREHIIIWAYCNKMFPASGEYIDHINGDASDNRIDNLRIVTHAENHRNRSMQQNNTSGFTGVSINRAGNWRARVKINGKEFSLGTYNTITEAAKAREAFIRSNDHGFTKRHGSNRGCRTNNIR